MLCCSSYADTMLLFLFCMILSCIRYSVVLLGHPGTFSTSLFFDEIFKFSSPGRLGPAGDKRLCYIIRCLWSSGRVDRLITSAFTYDIIGHSLVSILFTSLVIFICRMSDGYQNITLVVPRPSSGQDPFNAVLAHSTIPKSLPVNHIVVRVDRFGFSSNNITYQALGEEPHFR
jgi:hypothetical protein